jgi:hypothetical protein
MLYIIYSISIGFTSFLQLSVPSLSNQHCCASFGSPSGQNLISHIMSKMHVDKVFVQVGLWS